VRRYTTRLVRHILFSSFWSFILVLSGVVDAGIGLTVFFTGVSFKGRPPLPVFAICLAVGAFYLVAGVIVGLVTLKRRAK